MKINYEPISTGNPFSKQWMAIAEFNTEPKQRIALGYIERSHTPEGFVYSVEFNGLGSRTIHASLINAKEHVEQKMFEVVAGWYPGGEL